MLYLWFQDESQKNKTINKVVVFLNFLLLGYFKQVYESNRRLTLYMLRTRWKILFIDNKIILPKNNQ